MRPWLATHGTFIAYTTPHLVVSSGNCWLIHSSESASGDGGELRSWWLALRLQWEFSGWLILANGKHSAEQRLSFVKLLFLWFFICNSFRFLSTLVLQTCWQLRGLHVLGWVETLQDARASHTHVLWPKVSMQYGALIHLATTGKNRQLVTFVRRRYV